MGRGQDARGWIARVLLWAGTSLGLLVGGFGLIGAVLVAVSAARTGAELGSVQLAAWRVLGTAIVVQALLPAWALTLASWLVLVRLLPALDRSWLGLVSGLLGVALLWFPLVARSFRIWTPTRPLDIVNTALLVSGSAAVSLLLPRLSLPFLAPGALLMAPESGETTP